MKTVSKIIQRDKNLPGFFAFGITPAFDPYHKESKESHQQQRDNAIAWLRAFGLVKK